MYITNVTYDYVNMTLCNCTNNDNNDTNNRDNITINYNHTMWNVTYLFIIFYGIHIN